jgi:hypothetical protein
MRYLILLEGIFKCETEGGRLGCLLCARPTAEGSPCPAGDRALVTGDCRHVKDPSDLSLEAS